MENIISRSEKKRQAKQIEKLAHELADLPANDISALPCDAFLREEIRAVRKLKAGARKRQIKFIAKELRNASSEELLAFLEKRRGSRLKEKKRFHDLELLREAIITEAIEANEEARETEQRLASDWRSPSILKASRLFPGLDADAVGTSALRFAKTRKPAHSREIFRLLKASQERLLRQRKPNSKAQQENT